MTLTTFAPIWPFCFWLLWLFFYVLLVRFTNQHLWNNCIGTSLLGKFETLDRSRRCLKCTFLLAVFIGTPLQQLTHTTQYLLVFNSSKQYKKFQIQGQAFFLLLHFIGIPIFVLFYFGVSLCSFLVGGVMSVEMTPQYPHHFVRQHLSTQ